jgi:hypothetical protein
LTRRGICVKCREVHGVCCKVGQLQSGKMRRCSKASSISYRKPNYPDGDPHYTYPPRPNPLIFLLRLANSPVQIPLNRSSHSSSSCESNSIRESSSHCSVTLPPASSHATLLTIRLVSRMYFPTLYRCASSSASTYFHPSTVPHSRQLMSLTVCAPVTRWRGTGACVRVLGMSPCVHSVLFEFEVLGGKSDEEGGGETKYARPWRPVKPLDMIEDVGSRSARHFWQESFEEVR